MMSHSRRDSPAETFNFAALHMVMCDYSWRPECSLREKAHRLNSLLRVSIPRTSTQSISPSLHPRCGRTGTVLRPVKIQHPKLVADGVNHRALHYLYHIMRILCCHFFAECQPCTRFGKPHERFNLPGSDWCAVRTPVLLPQFQVEALQHCCRFLSHLWVHVPAACNAAPLATPPGSPMKRRRRSSTRSVQVLGQFKY